MGKSGGFLLSLVTRHSSPMLQPKSFLYDVRDGVAWVTLNRPERLNALTFEVYRELTDAFAALEHEPQVRAAYSRLSVT